MAPARSNSAPWHQDDRQAAVNQYTSMSAVADGPVMKTPQRDSEQRAHHAHVDVVELARSMAMTRFQRLAVWPVATPPPPRPD